MKKLFFTLSIIGLSMVSFTSCEEDEVGTPNTPTPPTQPAPECYCGYIISGEMIGFSSYFEAKIINYCSGKVRTVTINGVYTPEDYNGEERCFSTTW